MTLTSFKIVCGVEYCGRYFYSCLENPLMNLEKSDSLVGSNNKNKTE